MMRPALLASLFTLSAVATTSGCATSSPDDPAPVAAASVRERLTELTSLHVGATASAGAITIERKVTGGWEATRVELAIENGELLVSADAAPQGPDGMPEVVTIDGFQLSFAPFDIPQGVFGGQHAQLTDVRLDLEAAHPAPAVWTGDNEVHLTALLDLSLSWSLLLDGNPAPLGSPTLPPIPVAIVLTGDGEHVTAALRADAPGELWSWAGLLKLSSLELIIDASL